MPEGGERPRRWAEVSEVMSAIAAGLRPVAPTEAAADAVFAQAPPAWSVEGWRLLGVAGLALYPWPRGRPDPTLLLENPVEGVGPRLRRAGQRPRR